MIGKITATLAARDEEATRRILFDYVGREMSV
jgi:hypothetical protein